VRGENHSLEVEKIQNVIEKRGLQQKKNRARLSPRKDTTLPEQNEYGVDPQGIKMMPERVSNDKQLNKVGKKRKELRKPGDSRNGGSQLKY